MYNLNVQFRVEVYACRVSHYCRTLFANSWDKLCYSNVCSEEGCWKCLGCGIHPIRGSVNLVQKRAIPFYFLFFFWKINEGFLDIHSSGLVVYILKDVIGCTCTNIFILHEETAVNLLELFSREAAMVAHSGTVIWRRINRKQWLNALWICFLYCRK